LEIACSTARYGTPMTYRQIAAFCNCHRNLIVQIEARALMRLRLSSRIDSLTK
jgi:DNA-directed RNA polymerase sigma subunit (sigma70/sigma32)